MIEALIVLLIFSIGTNICLGVAHYYNLGTIAQQDDLIKQLQSQKIIEFKVKKKS